jgi:hypothetical protein
MERTLIGFAGWIKSLTDHNLAFSDMEIYAHQ